MKISHRTKNFRNAIILAERKGNYINFYIVQNGEKRMLFISRYYQSVYNYYKNGVRYGKAVDHTMAKHNKRLCDVMSYIPKVVKYVYSVQYEIYSVNNVQATSCA